jgi:diguanylate cyclase (GGDEF)-like protein
VARRVAFSAAAVTAAAATVVGLGVVVLLLGDQPAAVRNGMIVVAILGGATTVLSVAVGTVLIVNGLLSNQLKQLTAAIRLAEKGKWLPITRAAGPELRDDEIGEVMRAFDRLCVTVTDLSVAAIDSARELAWTRHELRLKEALSLLFELTQTLGEGDLATILDAIPAKVAPALGFERVAILLYDEDHNEFAVRATYGFAPGEIDGVRFPRDDVIAGAAADTGEPVVIPDTARDTRYSHFKGRHLGDGAFACIPMKVRGRLVGLFDVLRPERGAIGVDDLRLLTSLTSYTALAIAHLGATQRLRDLSITDELTGVHNRRYLLEKVDREIERVRRTGQPLAALMIDIDHFKRINDDLGHLEGDEVLRLLAGTLVGDVRRLDTVARYGGEEFVVLLPDTSRSQALLVAEKLRNSVAAMSVHDRRLTISIGVAVFPDDVPDGAGEPALIDAADRALLRAKRAGRNRVIAFEKGQAA